MTSLSGSPLYHYTLAMELLKQGHQVVFLSQWKKNFMQTNLKRAGAYLMSEINDDIRKEFDRIIISQQDHEGVLTMVLAKKIINVIHSEYEAETPITGSHIDEYIAIRPSIKQHLIEFHNIPDEKIRVVYNGVDFEKYSPEKRKETPKNYTKIVLPCTLDMLRKPFIEYYTKQARENFRVFLIGHDFGNDIYKNEWVYQQEAVEDLENYIADADYVAGILLGRVNLEARAMGILSYIHDPVDPRNRKIFFPEDEEFNQRHNITNVAKQIIC